MANKQTLAAHLIRGLLVMATWGLTIWVITFLMNFADGMPFIGQTVRGIVGLILPDAWVGSGWLKPVYPVLSLLLLSIIASAFGMIAQIWIGHNLIRLVNWIFETIPGVRIIFSFVKKSLEVFKDLDGESGNSKFSRVVAFQAWAGGSIAIGLVASETIDTATGKKMLCVFNAIQAPTPIGGQLLLIPEELTWNPGWTTEETYQFIMTMGGKIPHKVLTTRPQG